MVDVTAELLAVSMPVADAGRVYQVERLQQVVRLIATGSTPEDAALEVGFSKKGWVQYALKHPEAYDYIRRVNSLMRAQVELQTTVEMSRRLAEDARDINNRDLASFHASVKDEQGERGVEVNINLGNLF